MPSIFDILNPEPQGQGGLQGALGSGVRQLSDVFQQGLPQVLNDPQDEIGFGGSFLAGLGAGLGQPAREREFERQQQQENARQAAFKLLPSLDPASQQRAIQALTGSDDLDFDTPFMSEEQAAQLDFMSGLFNATESEEGRRELLGKMPGLLGLEFSEETIDLLSKKDENPKDALDKMAMDITQKMIDEDIPISSLPKEEQDILRMQNPNAFAQIGGSGGKRMTAQERLLDMQIDIFNEGMERMRNGEPAGILWEGAAESMGLLPKTEKEKSDINSRIKIAESLDRQAVLAEDAQDLPRADKLREEAANQMALARQELDSRLVQGIPPSTPEDVQLLTLEELADNPINVPRNAAEVDRLLEGIAQGSSEWPELDSFKADLLSGQSTLLSLATAGKGDAKTGATLKLRVDSLTPQQQGLLEQEIKLYSERKGGEIPSTSILSGLVDSVSRGILPEHARALNPPREELSHGAKFLLRPNRIRARNRQVGIPPIDPVAQILGRDAPEPPPGFVGD